MFEHAMESVQELALVGDQGLHLELAGREQMLVESAQVRVVLHGHPGAHVESAAQTIDSCSPRSPSADGLAIGMIRLCLREIAPTSRGPNQPQVP